MTAQMLAEKDEPAKLEKKSPRSLKPTETTIMEWLKWNNNAKTFQFFERKWKFDSWSSLDHKIGKSKGYFKPCYNKAIKTD